MKVSPTPQWIAGLALALLALPVGAQQSGDTVLVRPGRDYRGGPLHRWLLGDGYRDLWSIDIPVPVLELRALVPVGVDSVLGTEVLRLENEDGTAYEFLPADFEARVGLDPDLRASLAGEVLQDQVSSTLPLSGLVVSDLLAATGLPDDERELVVLPDDTTLGEHRASFAGTAGHLRPLRATRAVEADSTGSLLPSSRLFERLRADPDAVVDESSLLKMRLFDLLVGDWNRNPDRWMWVGRRETLGDHGIEEYAPLPGPRFWAFSRLDGLIQRVASLQFPQFRGYAPDYPPVEAAVRSADGLDPLLLTELDSLDFTRVAEELVGSLDDRVIEDAVGRLPDAYRDLVGDELSSTLKTRRDHLPDFAMRYYRRLARWVDVDGTDAADVVRIERRGDGATTVAIHASREGVTDGVPWYRRTFRPSQTEEVRIRTHGGDDRVEISGTSDETTVALRLLGGKGDDRFEDRTSGRGLWVHDSEGANTFDLGSGAVVDRSEWRSEENVGVAPGDPRPRDWGSSWAGRPTVGVNPDDGLVVGVAATRLGYGFQRYPWENRLELRASIGTGTWRPNLGLTYRTRPWAPSLRGEILVDWRGARADRFYGFGNDTEAPAGDDRYRAWRSEFSVAADLRLGVSDRTGVTLGAGYRRFAPQTNEGTLIAELAPYGYGTFEQFEVSATASWDRRDDPNRPRSGHRILLAASAVPPRLDVTETYAVLSVVASTYVGLPFLPMESTLATRVTGKRTLGHAPYFADTSIGGDGALRGFRNQRFLGDAALAASVEVRGQFVDFSSVFPGEVGLLGLVDTGRVWFDGASPGPWHTGVGGGVWARLLDRYAFSLTVARGERWGVYFTFGMPF